MNPAKRIFCRAYQFAFHAALPLLPYREPELPEALAPGKCADYEPLELSLPADGGSAGGCHRRCLCHLGPIPFRGPSEEPVFRSFFG